MALSARRASPRILTVGSDERANRSTAHCEIRACGAISSAQRAVRTKLRHRLRRQARTLGTVRRTLRAPGGARRIRLALVGRCFARPPRPRSLSRPASSLRTLLANSSLTMLPSLERLVPRFSRTARVHRSLRASRRFRPRCLARKPRTDPGDGFACRVLPRCGTNHRLVASQRLNKHGRFAFARRSTLGASLPSPCYRTLTAFVLLCCLPSAMTTSLVGPEILSPASHRSLRPHSSLRHHSVSYFGSVSLGVVTLDGDPVSGRLRRARLSERLSETSPRDGRPS